MKLFIKPLDRNKSLLLAGLLAAIAIGLMGLYVAVISPKLVVPAETYTRAVKLYEAGDFKEAALKLETIKEYSDAETFAKRAWRMAGESAFNAGNIEEAVACYARSDANASELRRVDEAFLSLAEQNFKKGDISRGEIYLGCVQDAEAHSDRINGIRLDAAKRLLNGREGLFDDFMPVRIRIGTAEDLLESCGEEYRSEAARLLYENGEDLLTAYETDGAYASFAAAKRMCPRENTATLLAMINYAWNKAGDRAMEEGNYSAARRCYAMVGSLPNPEYGDENDSERYNRAVALCDEGDFFGALAVLETLEEDYEDSARLIQWIRSAILRMPAAGARGLYALRFPDGMVEAFGNDAPFTETIGGVYAAVGFEPFILIVNANGEVLSFGESGVGRIDVSGWTDIIQVACGGSHAVGLRSNGTVVSTGFNMYGQCETSYFQHVISIAAGENTTYVVTAEGKVYAIGDNSSGQCEVSDWSDIVSVSAGLDFAVGLRSDGTLVACGNNSTYQCEVDNWNNIVQVSCGANHTVGLHGDGTLIASGNNSFGQCEVSGLTGVAAVSCGDGYTLVVFSDGTVRVIGSFDAGAAD